MPEKDSEAERERRRQYHIVNRERDLANMRNWREANPEYMTKYRQVNRERLAEHHREYRAANRHAISERRREYRAAHRSSIAEYQQRYREKNREPLLQWQQQYNRGNRGGAVLAKQVASQRQRNEFTRSKAGNNGAPWTAAEDGVVSAAETPDIEIALTLGRTLFAVQERRRNIRRRSLIQ